MVLPWYVMVSLIGNFSLVKKKKFNREAPFVWDAVLLQDFGDRCEIPFLCHGELAIRNLGGKAWILML